MQDAIASCLDKKYKYPEMPFVEDDEPETPEAAVARFAAWASTHNRQLKKGGLKCQTKD